MSNTDIAFYLIFFIASIRAVHFRGGYISWQTVSPSVTNTTTVTIIVQQTYSWAYSTYPCGPPIGDINHLTCISSTCSNYVSTMVATRVPCISYDVGLGVSTGESTTSVTLLAGSQLIIGYISSNWLVLATGLQSPWRLITSIDLTVRSDNGRINSSPTSSMAALVTVPITAQQTLCVPMADVDLDVVKCRWASSTTTVGSTVVDECSSVCQYIPGAQLYSSSNTNNNCTIVFTATLAGYYVVALQIEDFMPSAPNGSALSSIPLQFLVLAIDVPCDPPSIIGQLANGATVQVQASTTFSVSVIAEAGCNETIINRFSTITLPQGTTLLSTVTSLGSLLYSMVFTWTPTVAQVGSTQVYCTMATDSNNLESVQYCLNFVVFVITTTTSTSTTSSTSTSASTSTTSTTSTSASTSTTSTTSTSASTSTTTTELTTTSSTPISTVITTQSNVVTAQSGYNLSLLILGLALGLGLPLLLLLSALSICACCRWCPGGFWKKTRHRFWNEKETECQVCRSRKVYRSITNDGSEASNKSSDNYRRQYINDDPRTSKKRLSKDNLFLSDSLSPSDLSWMTLTRTNLIPSRSNRVMPSVDVPIQVVKPEPPPSSKHVGSILVRAYVEQEGVEENISLDCYQQGSTV